MNGCVSGDALPMSSIIAIITITLPSTTGDWGGGVGLFISVAENTASGDMYLYLLVFVLVFSK